MNDPIDVSNLKYFKEDLKQFLADKLAEFEKNYLVSAGGIETVFAIESYS
jgi:hypothetical protein